MAVRSPKGLNLVIDVHLKNGEKFIAKDIPMEPFGKYERMVSFWHDDKVVVYPLTDVEKVVLYELER
jgi:hypothetical protein